MSNETEYRSGFVTIVGRPNAGKSTLVNALVGQKVAIVSDKPQTTRNKIQCVYSRPGLQMVFLDTPGVHKPRHRLGSNMVEVTWGALAEVDAILFLVDASQAVGGGDRFIAQRLERVDTPIVLGLNKTDLADNEADGIGSPVWAQRLQGYADLGEFAATVRLSAKQGRNLDGLVAALAPLMPPGPQYYPEDWVVDHPEQFVIAELVREKVLQLTRDEIPHSVALEIEHMARREDADLVDVHVTIFVERDSQRGILIGKGGQMLRRIGELARADVEALLDTHVNLQLWVKARPGWRDDERALKRLGYE